MEFLRDFLALLMRRGYISVLNIHVHTMNVTFAVISVPVSTLLEWSQLAKISINTRTTYRFNNYAQYYRQ